MRIVHVLAVATHPTMAPPQGKQFSLASRLIHADDGAAPYTDVAPAMHVSTTFEYPNNPDDLHPVGLDAVSQQF